MYKFLTKVDTSKASGRDGISTRILKNTAANITPSLTNLFNLSLMTGTLPSQLKKSQIVPIAKDNNASSPYNYRPISLLPIISKTVERHVLSLIWGASRLIIHSRLTSGNSWRVGQQLLLYSIAPMNGSRL